MLSKLNPAKIVKLILTSDLLLPVFLLLSYLLLLFTIRHSFPSSEELIHIFGRLYLKFGYEIIFVAAFLEALAIINLIIPGGIVLALGVIFSRTGETDLALVILVGVSAAVCGYVIDYFLGTYGFSQVIKKIGYGNLLQAASKKLDKYGKRALILGFIQSNIGSFVSVAAGTLGFNFKTFLIIALISTLFWATIWGIAVYAIGDILLTIIRKFGYLLILFIIGAVFLSKLWEEKE